MKGGVEEATAMVMDLRENYRIFCSIVVYPVIPKGHIIYRLILFTGSFLLLFIQTTIFAKHLKLFLQRKENWMQANIRLKRYRIWQMRNEIG
jgi:hypothetical protein